MTLIRRMIYLVAIAVTALLYQNMSSPGPTERGYEAESSNPREAASRWWQRNKPGREEERVELKQRLAAAEALNRDLDRRYNAATGNWRPTCPSATAPVSAGGGNLDALREDDMRLRARIAELEG